MPLNKLENFIKNTEGRILYVNPSDLDSTVHRWLNPVARVVITVPAP